MARTAQRSKTTLGKPKRGRGRPKSEQTLYREKMLAEGKADGTPFKSKYPTPRIGNKGKLTSTKEWQDRFIRVLRGSHHIGKAVSAAGITRAWAYACKAADPDFRQRWIDAWEKGIDDLEAEAHRRAMDGSDLLMIFMLKGNRGEKYRERVIAEGANGVPLSFTLNIATSAPAEDEKPKLEEENTFEGQFTVVPRTDEPEQEESNGEADS